MHKMKRLLLLLIMLTNAAAFAGDGGFLAVGRQTGQRRPGYAAEIQVSANQPERIFRSG